MKIFLGLLLLAGNAHALSLNLDPNPSPIMIRELHDGQWLAGIAKDDIISHRFNNYLNVHAGLYQAWNAENGNPNFGVISGLDVPVNSAQAISDIGNGLQLPTLFKPAQYMASTVSIDIFAGYRPRHTADVNGNLVYGVGAKLKIAFGVKELVQGQ